MPEARKILTFFALTFGIGWGALILAYLHGARFLSDAAAAGVINVFSPTLAALICSLLFEKGRRLEALGFRFRPNRWWLWAALFAVGLVIVAAVAANPAAPFKLIGAAATARQLSTLLGQTSGDARGDLWQWAVLLPPALIAFSLFFTFSEEVGWRGYAYDLGRRFGFWRYSLGLGAIWGIWHLPINYLFGLNSSGHPLLGLLLFPVFCAMLSVPMTLVRDRGRSVLAPGIFHGTWNFLSLLAPMLFVAPENDWAKMGMGGCVATAIGALLVALCKRHRRMQVSFRSPIAAELHRRD